MIKKIVAICMTSLVMQNASAITTDSLSLESLLTVFDSPLGYVQGFLNKEDAEPLHHVTRSAQPIEVRFTIVHRFKQAGCARVQIDMKQDYVPTREMTFETVVFPPIQLNICDDGDPPMETEEVITVTEIAQKQMLKSNLQ